MAPGLDEFDVLLEVVLSLVRVIFHVRNASALMQENLRRVTTDQKSQFVLII